MKFRSREDKKTKESKISNELENMALPRDNARGIFQKVMTKEDFRNLDKSGFFNQPININDEKELNIFMENISRYVIKCIEQKKEKDKIIAEMKKHGIEPCLTELLIDKYEEYENDRIKKPFFGGLFMIVIGIICKIAPLPSYYTVVRSRYGKPHKLEVVNFLEGLVILYGILMIIIAMILASADD